jgi:hypothetical protein
MQYLAIGCRTAVVVVFLLAVTGKVLGAGAFAEFTRSVAQLKAAPPRLVPVVARATVLAEALTVLLLGIGIRIIAVIGFSLAIVLGVLFSQAILRSIRSGNRTACRCFGRSSSPLGPRHLVRNGLLLAVTVVGLASSWAGDSAEPAGALVAVLAGLFLGLIIASFDDLAQLLAPSAAGHPSR